jgi:hypothetical protein
MRSIASQWRHEDARELLAEDCNEIPDEPAANSVEFVDLVHKMRTALNDDAPAQGIFDHVLQQTSRDLTRMHLGLDATAYDTARRRMIRTLQRKFSPDWNSK